jgi:CRP-like cAMP-binding protein
MQNVSSMTLIRKLQGFYTVSSDLQGDLDALTRQQIDLTPGEHLLRAGDPQTSLYLVDAGWVLRSRVLPGGGRQVVSIAMPGDFLCFSSLMFETSDFDLVAKTPASVSRLHVDSFRELMQRHPGLAEALVWSTAHEESLLAERVVSLGRRDATERLAHILCEIVARLELIDRHDGQVLSLPLIQEDFADILGISVIHIVRTFKRLAELGAVEYRSRKLMLLDTAKLRRIAGFDGDYLHFSQRKDVRPLTRPARPRAAS